MDTVVKDKIVDLVLYAAPTDWTEEWLNNEVTAKCRTHKLKNILDIVPFFNALAHYAHNNIGTNDGSVSIEQIVPIVEEALDELENYVWQTAHDRLLKRHGEPKESI